MKGTAFLVAFCFEIIEVDLYTIPCRDVILLLLLKLRKLCFSYAHYHYVALVLFYMLWILLKILRDEIMDQSVYLSLYVCVLNTSS